MLSADTTNRLEHAVTDVSVGDEIAARLINTTPADAAAAQSILDILDPSEKMKNDLAYRLFVALEGDGNGRAGKELSRKLNGMVEVLRAKANGNEILATAAQFSGQVAGMTTDVTIDADVAGSAGNLTLVADSIKDIDTLISDWNTANPANTVTLFDGDGAQVPTANIVLSGGTNSSDSDKALTKAAMGAEPMSTDTFEDLVHALTSRSAAEEFRAAYNAMIAAVQAIV